MLAFIVSTAFAIAPYPHEKLLLKLNAIESHRLNRLAKDAPQIPSSAYRLAATGKVASGVDNTSGSGPKKGWGVAIFPLNINQIWAGVNDEFANSDYSPVSHTAIIAGQRCQEWRTVAMVLPLPIISDRWWMIDLTTNSKLEADTHGQVQELSWKEVVDPSEFTLDTTTASLTEGQVYVEFSRGAWFLVALDENHTLGEYYSWADPGGYIPDGATAFAASSIVDTFKGMYAFTVETPKLKCFK